jgi:5'-AMP-activated protein kinase catalytic alpha subunit
MKTCPKFIGDFQISKTLGAGAFSLVKLGKRKTLKVAIKIIDKTAVLSASVKSGKFKANEGECPFFLNRIAPEVKLLMRLDHPNIIKLYQMMENDHLCCVVM